MKKSSLAASLCLLSWLLVSPAMGQQQTAAEEQNKTAGEESAVSQTQVDTFTQREAARQRRDELLKMRAKIIEQAEQEQAPAPQTDH